MINGLHHITLVTADFDRLFAWYRDALGAEVALREDWDGTDEDGNQVYDKLAGLPGPLEIRAAVLRVGNAFLEIQEWVNPKSEGDDQFQRNCTELGVRHFCLDVTDVDAEVERLKAAGMTFPDASVQQATKDIRTVYGRDPDGNIVELQEIQDSSSKMAL